MNATAEAKQAQWKPAYGADYPDSTCAPNHALAIGALEMLIPINARAVAKEFGRPAGK